MLPEHGRPIGTEFRRQAGRAFDIADEKGDGPGWKLHHASDRGITLPSRSGGIHRMAPLEVALPCSIDL